MHTAREERDIELGNEKGFKSETNLFGARYTCNIETLLVSQSHQELLSRIPKTLPISQLTCASSLFANRLTLFFLFS
jgi:hypothetical protein